MQGFSLSFVSVSRAGLYSTFEKNSSKFTQGIFSMSSIWLANRFSSSCSSYSMRNITRALTVSGRVEMLQSFESFTKKNSYMAASSHICMAKRISIYPIASSLQRKRFSSQKVLYSTTVRRIPKQQTNDVTPTWSAQIRITYAHLKRCTVRTSLSVLPYPTSSRVFCYTMKNKMSMRTVEQEAAFMFITN